MLDKDYFYIECLNPDDSFYPYFIKNGSPNNISIQYSLDEGDTWNSFNLSSGVLVSSGKRLYLRSTTSTFSKDQSNYWYFANFMSSGLKIGGDIRSLINFSNLYAYCFKGLFDNLDYLVDASELVLNSSSLTSYCYYNLFDGCSYLTKAPSLPATTLADYCYAGMFDRCSSLLIAPNLPATSVPTGAYYSMFARCSNLRYPPYIGATSISQIAMNAMFTDCTSLLRLPDLKPTTIPNSGYLGMFAGCSKIKLSTTATGTYQKPFRIPYSGSGSTSGSYAVTNMFSDTGGTFTGTPSLNTTYYLDIGGITVDQTKDFFYLKSLEDGSSIGIKFEGAGVYSYPYIYWSYDKIVWELFSYGDFIYANKDQIVYFAGDNNATINKADEAGRGNFSFDIKGKFDAYGDIKYLLDKSGNSNTLTTNYEFSKLFMNNSGLIHFYASLNYTSLTAYCYSRMFNGCTNLVSAPQLPATTLTNYCYQNMFQGCKALTTAPQLPATTLGTYCYQYMFDGCTHLVTAPQLPATTLTNYCYRYMFQNCTSLTEAPELPATTLANYCYNKMFNGCTSLIEAPELPATNLADYCYSYMFQGCKALTTSPELPATTLANYCYNEMFYNCTALITPPELPATTLANNCYYYMFENCKALLEIPQLPAITLTSNCYRNMFYGCISIKVSTTQTGEYTLPYRIPTSGTGVIGTTSLNDMFKNTGGTFTGTPSINTTYYLYSPTYRNVTLSKEPSSILWENYGDDSGEYLDGSEFDLDAECAFDFNLFKSVSVNGTTIQDNIYTPRFTKTIEINEDSNIVCHLITVPNVTLTWDHSIHNCHAEKQWLNETTIKVKAFDSKQYRDSQFVGWFIGGQLVSTEYEYTFTVTENLTIECRFEKGYEPELNIIGPEGSTCLYQFNDDDINLVTLIPSTTALHYSFEKYVAYGQEYYDINQKIKITSDATIDVHFIEDPKFVIEVSSNVVGASIRQSAKQVYKGDTVELFARDTEGYAFSKWSDGATENPHDITVMANTYIEAIYEKPPSSEAQYFYRAYIKDQTDLTASPTAFLKVKSFDITEDLLSTANSKIVVEEVPDDIISEGDVIILMDAKANKVYQGVITKLNKPVISIKDNNTKKEDPSIECSQMQNFYNGTFIYAYPKREGAAPYSIEEGFSWIISDYADGKIKGSDYVDPSVSERLGGITISFVVVGEDDRDFPGDLDSNETNMEDFLYFMFDKYDIIPEFTINYSGSNSLKLHKSSYESIKIGNNTYAIKDIVPTEEVNEVNRLIIFNQDDTYNSTWVSTITGEKVEVSNDEEEPPGRYKVTKTKIVHLGSDSSSADIKGVVDSNLPTNPYNHKVTFSLMKDNYLYKLEDFHLGMPLNIYINGKLFESILTGWNIRKDEDSSDISIDMTCGKVRTSLTKKLSLGVL